MLPKTYPFLQGGGEMGELTRNFDWSSTPVGSPEEWPHSLRITVSNLLRSKFAMFLWWGDDMIQFYNDAYRPSLGNNGKHPHALGQKGKECWPEIWDIISPLHQQVRTTGEATWMENQLVPIYRNGKIEEVYWTFSYSSVLDDDGLHAGILVTCMETTNDVIEYKKIEQSQQELLHLFEESPVAIATISKDDDLVFEYANSFYGILVGRKPQEIIGKPLLEALPELKGQGFDQLLMGVIKTGDPFIANEVAANIVREGKMETIYVDLAYQPRTRKNGTVNGVLVVATDVTNQVRARKKIEESEQQLQTALEQVRLSKEAAALGTFDMDLEEGTMHWDDRCRNLFGISHKDPVSYEKDFAGGLHPDDQDRILKVIDQLFNKSVSNGDYDVEYRTVGAEDGIIRWVRAKGKVYFNELEKPVRFIGSVLDITDKVMAMQKIERLVEERTKELAEANKTLQTINKELQRSNQNLEEFAYAASHDLKEPIRKIHFFSNRIKEKMDEKLSGEERKYFEKVENASNRMYFLIEDLLQYSQVSMQQKSNEEVNLKELLQQVLSDLEVEILEKNAKVFITELPIVAGHQRQIQQAFSNIISNALKYNKDELPPEIRISYRYVSGAETGLPLSAIEMQKSFHAIRFTDNGIGFEQEEADRIFNVFTRLHSNAYYKGTGLGLSIVRRVMQNHNGYVTAKGAVGQGAVFELFLPE
jgi:PAS domain S-box-containing protein